MLLLFTCSGDGTADRLTARLNDDAFRFNFDLLDEYEVELRPDFWRLTDPTGRSITSESCQRAFWWKAFSAWKDGLDKMLMSEHKYVFRDLYGLLTYQGKTVGNAPNWHDQLGKLGVLNIASLHIRIPDSIVTMKLAGIATLNDRKVVAKSLSSSLTSDNRALFTTEVSTQRLHPGFLWFLQEKLESRWDVTVFLCDGKLFAFKRDRSTLKGIDWRAEQSFDPDANEWISYSLRPRGAEALLRIARDLNVEFGRFDLMTVGETEELIFLEYNANGQWVFLDYNNRHGLLDAVADWLTRGMTLKHSTPKAS